MHSGASVNAVTKSGTNRFSGNAFEFVRDRRFNATNPFAAIGPDGKRVDDGLQRQPVRRHARRPDPQRQAVLLRRLPGHEDAPGAGREHRVGADRRDAGRRLHGVRVAGVQRRPADRAACAVRQQPHRSGALQPGGAEARRRCCPRPPIPAGRSPGARRATATSRRRSARSTTSGAPITRSSVDTCARSCDELPVWEPAAATS